tara:strand:+ start:366 stop:509 length:144 start_codon:yes stop_codon:yes gene_type:complete
MKAALEEEDVVEENMFRTRLKRDSSFSTIVSFDGGGNNFNVSEIKES